MNFLFIEELLLDIIDHKVFCVKCDHCEKTLANNFSLRRHIKLVHDAIFFMQNHFFLTEDKKHVCPKCSKTFDDKSNYNRHVLNHEKITYQCTQCEKTYENKASFVRHQKEHDPTKAFSCKMCAKVLSSKTNLEKHMKIFHEDSNENGEKILQFQGMFRTFSEVVSANSVASMENNTCETCKKSYSSNYHLKRHQKKHENNNDKETVNENFRCHECDKMYTSVGNLNRHKKNVHDVNPICKECQGLNHINAYNSMTK